MYIGLLPTWGDKWNIKRGAGPEVFTPQNAEVYGAWLGRRYRKTPNIVWILGGDRPIDTDTHKEIIRAMERGLRAGDGGTNLITFHPPGANRSSTWLHDEAWLDFNMRQNGHAVEFTGRYDQTRVDYDRTPIKPVLDGEPVYEDHPVSFDARRLGHSISSDVRATLWDLFSGAFGHLRPPLRMADVDDGAATHQQSSASVVRQSINRRGTDAARPRAHRVASFLTRIPDQDIIVTDRVPTSVPGAGRHPFTVWTAPAAASASSSAASQPRPCQPDSDPPGR